MKNKKKHINNIFFFLLFRLVLLSFAREKNYKEKDAGKVVLYSTSMGIVRETYAKCANVKQILRTLLVKFEERDIFMSSDYQQEIKDRMQSNEIQVPQLFVDGQHIGVSVTFHANVQWIEKMVVFYRWKYWLTDIKCSIFRMPIMLNVSTKAASFDKCWKCTR